MSEKQLQQLSQRRLQNLAIIVLRQFIHKHIGLGPFEPGDVVEAELIHFGFGGRLATRSNDKGDHFFAPVIVRPSNHGDLRHGRVP